MGSKQESLNKRIRETLSRLSDKELVNIVKGGTEKYTAFARKIAEEELSRRRLLEATYTQSASGHDPFSAAVQPQPAGDGRPDCYIEVWSERNFEGEHLRIEGPVECRTLEFSGAGWGETISSLRVGPTAFVLVYAEKEFKGAMMSFGPSQEAPNLEELSFNDEIDSIKLVNSIKIFDGLRAEDGAKATGARPPKKTREVGRRKPRTKRHRE